MADDLERINEIVAQIKMLRKELTILRRRLAGKGFNTNLTDERLLEIVEVYKRPFDDPRFEFYKHEQTLPGWRFAAFRCSVHFNLAESTIDKYILEAKKRGLIQDSEVQRKDWRLMYD